MKIFTPMYDKALVWSKHPRAPFILSVISFAESIIFPVPVDVMLAPMALGQPKRAYYFALLATIFSVLGGVAGYWLGMLAYEPLVQPALETLGYQHHFDRAQAWFENWGFWVVFLAGFSPIPFKVFTVAAGVMAVAFWPFVLAAVISRGLRFFLVAFLMKVGGPIMDKHLRNHMDTIGWGMVVAAVIAYLLVR